jgi:diguanylate cyclase (GGDEF)-like protein
MDLFQREQQLYYNAMKRGLEIHNGAVFDSEEYINLATEYGRLLKQFRKIMRLSDRTTMDLFTNSLELADQAYHDSLTGLYSRRFLDENLERIKKVLSRSNGNVCIMMIDIDFFKKYNDTYGHTAGDSCLKVVAQTLAKGITREGDFIVRYGGEEFLVVLPYTDEHGAHVTASRLLESVIVLDLPHSQSDVADCVTVSIGVTSIKVDFHHKIEDYIKCADKALYMAKQNGRNRYTYLKFEEDQENES